MKLCSTKLPDTAHSIVCKRKSPGIAWVAKYQGKEP